MSFKPYHADPEAGFTFVEVLLATTILATISILMAMSFSTTFSTVERVQENQRQEHEARLCLTMIADDLTGSRAYPGFPWTGRNGERDGQPADVLAIVTSSSARGDTNTPASDLVRVVYSMDGNRLVRWAMRNIYGISKETLAPSDVATDVAAFDLRYFDPLLNTWTDAWDGRSRNMLPRAVMIKLTLRNARSQPETYTQWLTIPSQG